MYSLDDIEKRNLLASITFTIQENRPRQAIMVLLFPCSCAFCTRQNISLSIQDSVMSGLNTSARKFRYAVPSFPDGGSIFQCLATVQLAKSNAEGLNFYVPGSSNGREATHEAPRCTGQVAGGEASEDVDEQVLRTVSAGQAPAALHYLRGDSARQIRTQSTSKESFNDLCPASATWACILCVWQT